jgi:hypothetical protein
MLAASGARAAPQPQPCADAAHALVLTFDGLEEPQRRAVEAEMRVEAARLGLQVCLEPLPRAEVTARVSAGELLLRLEAIHAGHVVGREVPLPEATQQAALELALILGDLVREALDSGAPPPRAALSLGARAAFDGFPLSQGWLFGGDLVLRHLWSRVGLELLASARGSRSFELAEGSVSMLGVGGGAALLVSLVRAGQFELLLSSGLRAQALRLGAASSGEATATPRWVPELDVRVGLLAELELGVLTLSLGLAGAEPLLGAVATVGGAPVTGISSPGLSTTLGFTLHTGGER